MKEQPPEEEKIPESPTQKIIREAREGKSEKTPTQKILDKARESVSQSQFNTIIRRAREGVQEKPKSEEKNAATIAETKKTRKEAKKILNEIKYLEGLKGFKTKPEEEKLASLKKEAESRGILKKEDSKNRASYM